MQTILNVKWWLLRLHSRLQRAIEAIRRCIVWAMRGDVGTVRNRWRYEILFFSTLIRVGRAERQWRSRCGLAFSGKFWLAAEKSSGPWRGGLTGDIRRSTDLLCR